MEQLVEREHAWGALQSHYEAVQHTRVSKLVVVLGPGGIGKTALISAFAESLGTSLIMYGRAEALEEGVPYGALKHAASRLLQDDSISESQRTAVEALLSLDTTSDAEHEFWSRVRQVLRELTHDGCPPVLILDDLHEADRDSIALLARLLRSPGTPLFILVTSRPYGTGSASTTLEPMVARMTQDGFAETIELESLSDEGVATLGRSLIGVEPTSVLVRYVMAATGGIPFHAFRLYSELARQGHIAVSERADLVPRSMAAFVSEATVMAGYLPEMTAEQGRVAQALAVLGRCRSGDQRLLQQLAQCTEPQVRMGVLALDDLGLLTRTDDGWVEFSHPILRSTVYARMPSARRAMLHDWAAAAMERIPDAIAADPFSYATHVERGVSATREQRRESALVAADAALSSAPLVAAHWLGRAADTLPPGDDLRVMLLARRSQACLYGTATNEAIEHGLQAIAEAGPGVYRDEMVYLVSWALFFSHRIPEASELEHRELTEHSEDRGNLIQLLMLTAYTFDAAGATALYAEAWEAAFAPTESMIVAVEALGSLVLYTDLCELVEDGELLRSRIAELLPQMEPIAAAEVVNGLGIQIGCYPGALREAVVGLDLADHLRGRRQHMSAWGFSEMAIANVSWYTGAWDTALGTIEDTVWSDEMAGNVLAAQMLRSIGVIILAQRGELDKARALGASIMSDLESPVRIVSTVARSMLLDDDAATELLLADFTMFVGLGHFASLGLLGNELYRRSRSTAAAERIPAALDELLVVTRSPLNRMWLLQVLGTHRCDADLLGESVRLAEAEGMPFEAARSMLALGVVTADPEVTTKAVTIFAELGATPWHKEAARLARSLGLRIHVPRHHPGGLTEQETAITRLVVEGLSNREIAQRLRYSEKRIEAVLTQVFRKVGVRRRYELITLAHEDPDSVFSAGASRL